MSQLINEVKKEDIVCPKCGENKDLKIQALVEDDGFGGKDGYLELYCSKCKKSFEKF